MLSITLSIRTRQLTSEASQKEEVAFILRKIVLFTILFLLLFSTILCAAPNARPEAEKTVQPAAFEPIIKYGMRGDDVKSVQILLAKSGFYFGDVDGIFGNQTLEAVKDFQRYVKLYDDGVVEQYTLAALKRNNSVETSRFSRSLNMLASAYSAYDPGCGQYTYRGSYLRKGLVAVDPSVIALGTRLYIPGYGFAVADDIGGAIKGNKIDLAFDSHEEALAFGVQRIKVYIVD